MCGISDDEEKFILKVILAPRLFLSNRTVLFSSFDRIIHD